MYLRGEYILSLALTSCRQSDIALNQLSKERPSILPLLQVLAPMIQPDNKWVCERGRPPGFLPYLLSDSEQAFQEGLLNAKWDRYFFYARRVKTLRHDDEPTSSYQCSHLCVPCACCSAGLSKA